MPEITFMQDDYLEEPLQGCPWCESRPIEPATLIRHFMLTHFAHLHQTIEGMVGGAPAIVMSNVHGLVAARSYDELMTHITVEQYRNLLIKAIVNAPGDEEDWEGGWP